MATGYAGDVTPEEAWKMLQEETGAVLVDVRSQPEWNYVGLPDLTELGRKPVLVQWQVFPTMAQNPAFAEELKANGIGPDQPVLFLCRSGVRSLAAAQAMTAQGFARCYNISGGFEGPLDEQKHRGRLAGWKASGLPWQQG
ncbi:rhodanese-like domain-containing protein [Telmatospirillum sp. J64-1]|uniref:rhodanese-like domain-containing protein n=1 Tax=Telmatospirillum sp. J64-1 TaxID=2502183 RepID=UPI001C8F8B1A|nr:rhodanese-like domain-containing protein [Telmatospirillum sp. J64-1]